MSSVINTNIASMNTQRNLSASQGALHTSLQRLSSGLRINSSKDDAAGLAIATRMDSQLRGMTVGIRNSNDAISFAQTAEGGLSKVNDALQRMRELAVQSANATNNAGDRTNLNAEFIQLQAEIARVTGNTNFNGSNTLAGGTKVYQVGANGSDTIAVTGVDLTAATSLTTLATKSVTSAAVVGVASAASIASIASVAGSGTTPPVASAASVASVASVAAADSVGLDVLTAANASSAIQQLDWAMGEVNTTRATYGAIQNRFESVIGNLQVSVENQAAAKSRIMDADFAAETANLTRGQILQQAGTAMLAQANSLPNGVLALLRG